MSATLEKHIGLATSSLTINILHSRLISRGEIFVDWIVKTFADKFLQVSTISPDKFHCLKIFVVKILRIEQNPRKSQNFHPSKLTRYMVLTSTLDDTLA